MSSKRTIEQQFYNIYKERISISAFEEWLYKAKEIESIYGDEFYFSLLDLNYKNKYIRLELKKRIEEKIPFGEFEQERISSLLKDLQLENGDAVAILEQLYDDYCSGYSFLRFLGLSYITGIDNIPKLEQKSEWSPTEFNNKRKMLNSIAPKLIKEAERLYSFLEEGKLVITEENKYEDTREEEEKVELYHIERMFKK